MIDLNTTSVDCGYCHAMSLADWSTLSQDPSKFDDPLPVISQFSCGWLVVCFFQEPTQEAEARDQRNPPKVSR